MRRLPLKQAPESASGRRLALFLDFDGTLSPHTPNGDHSAPLPATRAALAALARRSDVQINVISGRTVADLRKRVGLSNVTYSGNHGLVIAGPGGEFEHPLSSVASRTVNVAAALLRARIKAHVGAKVYHNGLSLSLNVGMMSVVGRRAAASLVDSLTPELRWLRLRWQIGHLGWDLVPEVGWTKGDALAHLMTRAPGAFAIAVGDGLSDEPMFERVRDAGFAVRVGKSRASAAEWFVRNPEEVAAFLQCLANRPEISAFIK